MATRERRRPGSKSGVIYRHTGPEVKSSSLATISVTSGVLSFLLPIGIGGLIAVITGQLALKRIRSANGRLRGRKLARIGRALGYVNLALLPLVIAIYLAWNASSASIPVPEIEVKAPILGVKLKADLAETDLEYIKKSFNFTDFDPPTDTEPAEELIAVYFAEKRGVSPEAALLTTKRFEHLDSNANHTTFALKGIDRVEVDEDRGDDQDLQKRADLRRYALRVKNTKKQTIYLPIVPANQGSKFYRLLEDARTKAKLGV